MKLVSVLIWIFLFTSCSQQRIAFRFADTAASWTADDYFDLTSAQKDNVKKLFSLFIKNLYENNDREIPKVFDQADLVLSRATEKTKIDCGDIEKIKARAGDIVPNLAKLGVIQIQTLLENLSEMQIQYFHSQVAEKIAEDEKKLKNSNVREEKRLEKTLNNLQLFLGRLSPEQEAAIRIHLKANPFPFEEQFKNKKGNYEKLKIASMEPAAFRLFVLDYILNWRNYQSVAYLKKADELRSENERFYQKLVCEASPKQINYLREKLSAIKRDFEEFFIHDKKGVM